MKTKIIIILLGVVLAFSGMAIADEIVINGVAQTPSASITGGTIDGTVIGGTTPAAGSFTDLSASGTLGGRLNRDFATLPFTNAAEQTAFSEANMKLYSAINNQGAGEETDVILVAVSYPIKFAVETSEAFQIELCPPAGEIFTHDGTALDANDCILSSATVGSAFMVKRLQIANGSWQYFTYTIQGVNTDGGAAD